MPFLDNSSPSLVIDHPVTQGLRDEHHHMRLFGPLRCVGSGCVGIQEGRSRPKRVVALVERMRGMSAGGRLAERRRGTGLVTPMSKG